MVCDVGLDWGGLRREWFEMLCSELFDATGCGLFIQFNTDTQALVGSSDDYVSNSRSNKTHPKWTRSDRRGSSATRSDRRGSSATRSIWTRSCQIDAVPVRRVQIDAVPVRRVPSGHVPVR